MEEIKIEVSTELLEFIEELKGFCERFEESGDIYITNKKEFFELGNRYYTRLPIELKECYKKLEKRYKPFRMR